MSYQKKRTRESQTEAPPQKGAQRRWDKDKQGELLTKVCHRRTFSPGTALQWRCKHCGAANIKSELMNAVLQKSPTNEQKIFPILYLVYSSQGPDLGGWRVNEFGRGPGLSLIVGQSTVLDQ